MMSLITCGSHGGIHQGHEWFSDDSRERQDIFMVFYLFGCFIMCAILLIANGGAKIVEFRPLSYMCPCACEIYVTFTTE